MLAVIVAMVAIVAPSGDAEAADPPRLRERMDVAPGLLREVYGFQTAGGPNEVNVLRFALDDSRLSVRPELARGHVPGRETVGDTLKRLGPQAVAGVNASFFAPSCGQLADGDPCGLLIRDGIVASENHKNGGRWPGAFALFDPATHDTPWAVENVSYEGVLDFNSTSADDVPLNGINRQPRSSEVVAFNTAYGTTTGTPSGTREWVLPDLSLHARTYRSIPWRAPDSTSGNSVIPQNGTVLAATGDVADDLTAVPEGTEVLIESHTAGMNWNRATQAVGAGPMIVQDGRMTHSDNWFSEGFSDRHNDQAHPRTVVGFRADGEMLMVTVDGRRSDSIGITTGEAAELMLDLGVRDAVMMDGGGSTTMAVDGVTANIPCSSWNSCGSPRAVASSLVVSSAVETPDVRRLHGPSRYATAAATARDGWPDGAPHVVIASGEGFADALTGGPFAGRHGAPLLLTASQSIPSETLAALRDLKADRVTLLGGEAAISEDVADRLRRLNDGRLTVTRLSGKERTETAAAVARQIGSKDGRAFLASATAFPDALSTAVPASRIGAPLLLTWPDRLAESTADALSEIGIKEVLVAGGRAAVSDAVLRELEQRSIEVSRIAGKDRFETSVALVDWAVAHTKLPTDRVALATGSNYPDALAGGPYGAKTQTPVLLTHPLDVDRSDSVGAWCDRHDLSKGVLFGGPAALAGWHRFELQQHIDAQ